MNAKEQSEIAEEKEIIDSCIVLAEGKNKYGNLTSLELQEEINKNTEKEVNVIDNGDTLLVNFINSNRYYEVDNNGNVKKIDVIMDENPGNITVRYKRRKTFRNRR